MVKNWLRVVAITVTIGTAFPCPTTDTLAQNITLDGSLGKKKL